MKHIRLFEDYHSTPQTDIPQLKTGEIEDYYLKMKEEGKTHQEAMEEVAKKFHLTHDDAHEYVEDVIQEAETMPSIEYKPIKTIADIEKFFRLCTEILDGGFHPDTPFEDYEVRNQGGKPGYYPTFTKEQARVLNKMMDEAFKVADKELPNKKYSDIYAIGVKDFQKKGYLPTDKEFREASKNDKKGPSPFREPYNIQPWR